MNDYTTTSYGLANSVIILISLVTNILFDSESCHIWLLYSFIFPFIHELKAPSDCFLCLS